MSQNLIQPQSIGGTLLPANLLTPGNTTLALPQGAGQSVDVTTGQVYAPQVIGYAPTVLYNNQTFSNVSMNGDTGDISGLGNFNYAFVDCNVTAFTGGSGSPTFGLKLDRKGADGVYYALFTSNTVSGIATVIISLGPGCSSNHVFGTTIRVRYVLGGTTNPTVSFGIIVTAK